ncbi:MAG: hypothetical protein GY943_16755 [Chloroflexi bacterium]|nr:hypothetical protein [Chloroflexota bacterium]
MAWETSFTQTELDQLEGAPSGSLINRLYTALKEVTRQLTRRQKNGRRRGTRIEERDQ